MNKYTLLERPYTTEELRKKQDKDGYVEEAVRMIRERQERRAIADGWAAAGPQVAHLLGLATGRSRRADPAVWGYSRREVISWHTYSRGWHSRYGPARWVQPTAHVEYRRDAIIIVGHPARGRDRRLILNRVGRYRWRGDGVEAVAIRRNGRRHLAVHGYGWTVLATGGGGAAGAPRVLVTHRDAEVVWSAVEGRFDPAKLWAVVNSEVVCAIAELVGLDRIVEGLRVVHKDNYGVLYRHEWGSLSVCRVVCPSTGRTYLLRVPATVKTAHEAVAWTFGLRPSEYRPDIES